jgi:hypothetical protein
MSSKTILVSICRCYASPLGEKRNSMLLRGGETVEIMLLPCFDGLMASQRKLHVPDANRGFSFAWDTICLACSPSRSVSHEETNFWEALGHAAYFGRPLMGRPSSLTVSHEEGWIDGQAGRVAIRSRSGSTQPSNVDCNL